MIEERIGCGPQIGRQIVSDKHAPTNWVDGKASSFCRMPRMPKRHGLAWELGNVWPITVRIPTMDLSLSDGFYNP